MPFVKKIFIADDNLDDIMLFREALMLESDNLIKIQIVYSGIQLLHRLERTGELPEIVFLDINMPGQNGFDCLRKIRNRREWDKINVIMHSISDDEDSIHKSYKLGANLYVVKATNFKVLRKNIRKCIFYDWYGPDFYDNELRGPLLN